MSASVYCVEVRTAKVEVVAVWIAGIYCEVPASGIPVERTVEIRGCAESSVLPVEQDVAEVEVALSPVCSVQVVIVVDSHQIVKVHFIGGLILVVGEIELVCHLVGEEQCSFASLLVTHC